MARATGLARVARQSNRIHDRLARRVIWHLREETFRAGVVNLLLPRSYEVIVTGVENSGRVGSMPDRLETEFPPA